MRNMITLSAFGLVRPMAHCVCQAKMVIGKSIRFWKPPLCVSKHWKKGEMFVIRTLSKPQVEQSASSEDVGLSGRRSKTTFVISELHETLNIASLLLFSSKKNACSVGNIGNRGLGWTIMNGRSIVTPACLE